MNQPNPQQDTSEQCLAEHLQMNSANEQRIAGGNYHENGTSIFYGKKGNISGLSDAELDKKLVESEDIFIDRFSKDYNASIRQKIVMLRQQRKLTIREVKQLLLTGRISVNRRTEEVTVDQERYSYIYGWLMLSLTSAYYLSFILAMALSNNVVAWKQMVAQLSVACVCGVALWVYYWAYISPYQLVQRTNKQT